MSPGGVWTERGDCSGPDFGAEKLGRVVEEERHRARVLGFRADVGPLYAPDGARASMYCVPACRLRPASFDTYHLGVADFGTFTTAPVASRLPC